MIFIYMKYVDKVKWVKLIEFYMLCYGYVEFGSRYIWSWKFPQKCKYEWVYFVYQERIKSICGLRVKKFYYFMYFVCFDIEYCSNDILFKWDLSGI